MDKLKRLAIITSHPIQYNAPVFQLLRIRGKIKTKVFYTWGEQAIKERYDPGFDRKINWDIPLLDGYDFEFMFNKSSDPGSHHFRGIINPDLKGKIIEYNPDTILVYGWAFHSHLEVLRYFHNKVRILFRGDSTLLDTLPIHRRILRNIFLKWIYRHVDKAIYVGKNNYLYYKEFGLNDNQLIYAPHAVDNERFGIGNNYYNEGVKSLRKEAGLNDDKIVFVFAGKLIPVKDIPLLLKAFTGSDISHIAELIIIGNGPLENSLKAEFGNFPGIHFLPFQNQNVMPAVYRMGNYFVLPSKSETWGLAINEALASGVPVIASNRCGGAIDLIEDGKNGYIFESGNQDSLAQALKKAISTKMDYQKMVDNAKLMISRFSFQNIAEVIEREVILNKRTGQF
ncbi:glycosyltransferase family 4 protein [Flavihumibacter sediminis]|nr:glycosyltransferase family 4 protein [Flavihumibacter sediminis]